MSLYKIQLENGEFYKSSKGGRVQHYRSMEKASAKIQKLGDIGTGAKVIESKVRTAAAKTENLEENASDTKVLKVSKAKKTSAKAKKTAEIANDEKVASVKAKKAKK